MISVPFINPLRFKVKGATGNYNTWWFDEFLLPDTRLYFEEPTDYIQKFNATDPLVLYIESDKASLAIFYIDKNGRTEASDVLTPVSSRVQDTVTIYVYVYVGDLSILPREAYSVHIKAADLIIESNPICIEDNHLDTVQVLCGHPGIYEDIAWPLMGENLICLRVDGFVRHKMPERQSTTYEDQPMNMTQLKTVAYNSYSFITESHGIPTYLIDIMNRAFGCPTLYLDGRLFTVPGEAKWEEKEEDLYLLRGWGIDLRESIVRNSKRFDVIMGGGPGSGGGGPVANPKLPIDSDWFETVPGTYEVLSSVVGSHRGYTLADVAEALEIDRDGTEYNMVNTTPVNREARFDGILKKIVFDMDHPFEVDSTGRPERVFVLFKRQL